MDAIQELLAKQAISEVIVRYARAIDRLDEAMLRSVFHADSQHNHFYSGPSSDPSRPAEGEDPGDFVRYALQVLSSHLRTHHQLGNTLITLENDRRATAESYFTAYHRMRAHGDPLAAPNAYATEMDFFVGGRYLDVFECRDGLWGIVERVGMTDWTRIEGPSANSMAGMDPDTLGGRHPNDRIYWLHAKQS